ncbi:MAG: hypothetical protein FJY99_03515 [Candidatus Sericytochromatia bacterium]|nr:hypothetical protein [Candidatus Tanganyikabacteria bacterium]
MEAMQREALVAALRKAADQLAAASSPALVRKDVLAACRKVQEAFLALGFDELASRKRIVYFLRSMELANGVVGARTAQRLLVRTFEEEAELAEKWLVDNDLLSDHGDEGILLAEAGIQYLTQHRAEFPVLGGGERRGNRGGRDYQHARGGRGGAAPSRPAPVAATSTVPAPVVVQVVDVPAETTVEPPAADAAPAPPADADA